jgi:hypothetical protein
LHHRDRTNARRWGRRMLAGVLGSLFLAPLPVIANAQAADSFATGTLSADVPIAEVLPTLDPCTIDPTLPGCPTPPPSGSTPPPSNDTTPPETTITSGPSGWLLNEYAVFGYSASEPASAFACRLDATPSECGGDKELVAGFASGTHTFAVAATDGAGNQDPTPATRTFTAPRDDRAMTRSKGWSKRTGSGYLMDTYCTATSKGAKLTTKAAGVRTVALVVGKGKGYGTVKVMLGTKVLKKVSLASRKTKKRALVAIAAFPTARSGKISVVVVSSGKKVVVDGIGLATG